MPARKKVDTTKFTLESFEAMCLEALGEKPGLTLELNDGTELYISHPAMVGDEQLAEIERVQNGRDLDEETYTDDDGNEKTRRVEKINGVDAEPFAVRLARAVLGDAEHKRFIAAGGKSTHILQAWQWLAKTDEDDESELDDPKLEK